MRREQERHGSSLTLFGRSHSHQYRIQLLYFEILICKRRERIIHSWTGRFWSRYTRSLKINVLMKIERERRRIMSLPRIAFWKAEQTRPCGYGPPFLNLKRKRREVSHSILEFELLLSHRSHWRVVVVSACKKSPERKEVM
jgi:hypothetical protein